jgi:hypothetical protein
MVIPLDRQRCSGTVQPTAASSTAAQVGTSLRNIIDDSIAADGIADNGIAADGIAADSNSSLLFSIMSISDLFGHRNPAMYNGSYFAQLWAVLDPVVDALNASGQLPYATVYGFDEAHPKAVYEPIIAQLFGAVKARYVCDH